MFDKVSVQVPERIRIARAAYETIEAEAAVFSNENETGGILLGHNVGTDILISLSSGPGPAAVHERDRLERDTQHAATAAQTAWDRDRSQWIGEWHTHPRSSLVPSHVDVSTYRRHLADAGLCFDRFVAIVVRAKPDRIQFVGWIVTNTCMIRVPIVLCG
ncbi:MULTISPECIES: Mov34/MPN/PAD-1 family protein [Curtobacterium]|uniref:Mov34/MPN/PAD-1 family protein n=1 Tax=Curtobacterium TaxID=2034 RepID=UPI00217E63BE|nr:Mov34/MPN/PAD-1 family protein [Curtobacterium flaccumfaciens]MCS6562298.1 Mov34/MPN/PAD-1 family protein [Curtobacterium flaccumfaciens pv. poinsettiae]UXN28367.1 Mov34/MPN/PAD-1 family protein [Curtobacterium flaccumfaciens]